MPARQWNHSIHYYPVVLRAVPAGAQRGLEVGCGHGMLARALRQVIPRITAIDADGPTLAAARDADGGAGIEYVHADFLQHDFEPGSFDFICAVAVVHHMDATAALRRTRELLRPGGRLAIIGCATGSGLADLSAAAGGAVLHRLQLLRMEFAEVAAPTCWPPPETYAGMRRLGREVLPGAQFRRRLLWRYSLIWTKPSA
jgi:SAM-dependent methyltransferase